MLAGPPPTNLNTSPTLPTVQPRMTSSMYPNQYQPQPPSLPPNYAGNHPTKLANYPPMTNQPPLLPPNYSNSPSVAPPMPSNPPLQPPLSTAMNNGFSKQSDLAEVI